MYNTSTTLVTEIFSTIYLYEASSHLGDATRTGTGYHDTSPADLAFSNALSLKSKFYLRSLANKQVSFCRNLSSKRLNRPPPFHELFAIWTWFRRRYNVFLFALDANCNREGRHFVGIFYMPPRRQGTGHIIKLVQNIWSSSH